MIGPAKMDVIIKWPVPTMSLKLGSFLGQQNTYGSLWHAFQWQLHHSKP
jgi:hypothetical protein